jgi:hypothetical protein
MSIAWTAGAHCPLKYCIDTNVRAVIIGHLAVYHFLWSFILDLCVVVYNIAILSYVKRDLIFCLSSALFWTF